MRASFAVIVAAIEEGNQTKIDQYTSSFLSFLRLILHIFWCPFNYHQHPPETNIPTSPTEYCRYCTVAPKPLRVSLSLSSLYSVQFHQKSSDLLPILSPYPRRLYLFSLLLFPLACSPCMHVKYHRRPPCPCP